MSRTDAYPPIGDYALIGDCHSAALVSRHASIDWCCLPRFDSGSAFGRILDREHGGHCSITPTGGSAWEFSRRYLEDTLILETTLSGPTGEARILDCFSVPESARSTPHRQIIRVIEGLRGRVELALEVAPRFDYGAVKPWIRRHGHRLHSAIGGNDGLLVWCERELEEDPDHELRATLKLGAGDRVRLSLSYCPPELIDAQRYEEPDAESIDDAVEHARVWWQEWAAGLTLGTRDEPGARRSGLTLKALTHIPTGRSWPHRRAPCPRCSGASATGTTATRGSETPASAREPSPSSER